MNLFGTDGIRGIANVDLTSEIAFRLGRAMGFHLRSDADLAVGKDTRASGDMLEASIVAGITSAGRNVIRLGVITTPGLSYSIRHAGLGGGVMISASHNPAEYNGLKVFGPDGTKVPDEVEEVLSGFILDGSSRSLPTGTAIGRVIPGEYLVDRYTDFLIGIPGRSLAGLRLVVDAAHGSASRLAETVWRGVGAKVEVKNCSPDGGNINYKCGSTHLAPLSQAVRDCQAHAGFAYDGDGDRCMAVDEDGCEMNGDHMMGVLAEDMASRGALKGNTVVGTVMSNYGLETFLRARGLRLVRTQVGDRYVLEKMRQCGYSLGGEQSGHLIFRDILETGDGILTSLLVAQLLADSGGSMSDLRRAIVDLPQVLVNVKADNPKALAADEEVMEAVAKADLHLGGNGRVLVRASGTEPLVRIMVESQDESLVTWCIGYLKEVIEKRNRER